MDFVMELFVFHSLEGNLIFINKIRCVCVMEEGGYAANGVKHCVRPIDMTGKSAAIILRQMHE